MRLLVRLTFGPTLGQVELWSDLPSRMKLQFRLTFGQTLGQVELWSDVPLRMRPWVKVKFGQDEACGQVEIWSDFGSGLPLVRCTPWQRHLVSRCDTNLGQVDTW